MKIALRLTWSALVAVLINTPASFAAEPEAGHLARIWTILPKHGSEMQFSKAFAQHVQWRRDNKDPWRWNVYVQLDGAEVGARHAVSSMHQWSDFDAYDANDFSARASAHWNETVAPHIRGIRSIINEYLPDLSHWPADAPEYRLYQLHFDQVRIGQEWRYDNAMAAVSTALKDAKWPYHWGFFRQVSGGRTPTMLLVLPSMKWADMAEPDPNFFATLVEVRGQGVAQELMRAWRETVETTESVIVRLLPELSVPAPQ